MSLFSHIRTLRSDRLIEVHGIVDLHWDNAAELWVVDAPIRFIWSNGVTVFDFTVPKGFRTDLSSIPQWARSIIPVVGRQNRGSLGHDWAYKGLVLRMKRFDADLMFLDVMKLDEVRARKRRTIFAALRVGGGANWKGA